MFRKILCLIAVLCTFSTFLVFCDTSLAYDKVNRLGLGMTNELKNDFPALSFKMQKNRSFAFGGLFGLSTHPDNGGYGIGLKIYRNIFDEPQLNFYLAGMGAILNNKIDHANYSGFQFDLSLGSEFHFSGLQSLGFSFEFGASASKRKDFVFQTLGNNFIVSAIHFYL
jgi:hypothetical protein